MRVFWPAGMTALALVLVACSTPKSHSPITTPLEPTALQPAALALYPVGSTWTFLEDEREQIVVTLLGREEGVERYTRSDGCSFSVPQDFLAPDMGWENCGGSDGKRVSLSTDGQIWPLAIGNHQTWKVKGRYNKSGLTWTTEYDCNVVSAERIATPAGKFDAYRVVCEDDYVKKTFFFAPSAHDLVAQAEFNKASGAEHKVEIVSGPSIGD
jgi:hypothetical protein